MKITNPAKAILTGCNLIKIKIVKITDCFFLTEKSGNSGTCYLLPPTKLIDIIYRLQIVWFLFVWLTNAIWKWMLFVIFWMTFCCRCINDSAREAFRSYVSHYLKVPSYRLEWEIVEYRKPWDAVGVDYFSSANYEAYHQSFEHALTCYSCSWIVQVEPRVGSQKKQQKAFFFHRSIRFCSCELFPTTCFWCTSHRGWLSTTQHVELFKASVNKSAVESQLAGLHNFSLSYSVCCYKSCRWNRVDIKQLIVIGIATQSDS